VFDVKVPDEYSVVSCEDNMITLDKTIPVGTYVTVSYKVQDSFVVDVIDEQAIITLSDEYTEIKVYYEGNGTEPYYSSNEPIFDPLKSHLTSGFLYITTEVLPVASLDVKATPDAIRGNGEDSSLLMVDALDKWSNPVLNLKKNIIPLMTGYTTPSGVASSDTEYDQSRAAWNAFNGSLNSLWTTAENTNTGWVAYEFESPELVVEYAIVAHRYIPETAPKAWTFEGWNGLSWITLDTRANEINWKQAEKRYYKFSNSAAYKKYRINISANNGNNQLSLAGLEFFDGTGVNFSHNIQLRIEDNYNMVVSGGPNTIADEWPAQWVRGVEDVTPVTPYEPGLGEYDLVVESGRFKHITDGIYRNEALLQQEDEYRIILEENRKMRFSANMEVAELQKGTFNIAVCFWDNTGVAISRVVIGSSDVVCTKKNVSMDFGPGTSNEYPDGAVTASMAAFFSCDTNDSCGVAYTDDYQAYYLDLDITNPGVIVETGTFYNRKIYRYITPEETNLPQRSDGSFRRVPCVANITFSVDSVPTVQSQVQIKVR
jgi:hypothetical protein